MRYSLLMPGLPADRINNIACQLNKLGFESDQDFTLLYQAEYEVVGISFNSAFCLQAAAKYLA